MKTQHQAIVGILILLLGLISPVVLMAQEMFIYEANPQEAEQGDSLPLEISGAGFDNSVDKVSFKLPCNKKNCPDSGDIIVNSFEVISGGLIEAHISISLDAPTSSFDIAVRSTRGRGGKGTTYKGESKFTVKPLRPNQDLLSCGDVIENHQGTCTCEFVWSGDDSFLPTLLEDCETSETLNLKLRIRGSGDDPGNQSVIKAVPCGAASGQDCSEVGPGNFSGSSVIANTIHRASIRWLDIRFHKDIARGCGANDVQAAVSFILDEDTPDPKTTLPDTENPDPINRNSLLYINNVGVFSGDNPLCNGIEIVRTDWYTAEYSDTSAPEPARDWKIYATENLISTGSYERAGIVMLGIMPSESINPPAVFGNAIGAAACTEPDPLMGPMGIRFGSLTPDPVNQIDGVIENNVISMDSNCLVDTGIVVEGDPGGEQTSVKVNKNTITGAYLGVDVDSNVVDMNFSGNNLTGDDWPTGILSAAKCTTTKGKPNRISGYGTDISDAGCL